MPKRDPGTREVHEVHDLERKNCRRRKFTSGTTGASVTWIHRGAPGQGRLVIRETTGRVRRFRAGESARTGSGCQAKSYFTSPSKWHFDGDPREGKNRAQAHKKKRFRNGS